MDVVLNMLGVVINFILLLASKTAFIWAPVFILNMAFHMWHHFVTDRFVLGMKWTLFEISVPRDVEKTPMAMELIFTNALYHASAKGLWEIWIQGAPHFWFSLEIAGVDGRVGFYIRTPSRIRDLVETQIYAQYPQAKVAEVDDYTLSVPFDAPNEQWFMWGAEWKLLNPDPYPIRTYKSYGLDKAGEKEQFKIDPLTPTIEYLGSLKRGQQVWIQHVVRPSKKAYHSHHAPGGHHGWIDECHAEIDRLIDPYKSYKEKAVGPGAGGLVLEIRLPKPVEVKFEYIREKMEKTGFDVGIRVVTVADRKYNSQDDCDTLRRSARLLFRQYNAPDCNSLVRVNATQFDSVFSDPTGLALWNIKNRMLNWYRLRIFYHPPFWYNMDLPGFLANFFRTQRPHIIVLNVEELATLFHFPGQVSQAPSFKRVESRVAKPPSNLPM